MRRKRKRLGSLLIVLEMLLAMVSVSAMAAEGETVLNESALKNAVTDAENGVETIIALNQDIALTSRLEIPAEKNIVLDLNGYAVTVPAVASGSSSIYAIYNYGTLTICDTSTKKDGSINSRGVQNLENGVLTLESGTINSIDSNGGGAAMWNEGAFYMTGGTLAFTGEKNGNSAGAPLNNQFGAYTTITGGSLSSPYTCVFNSGHMKISDVFLSGQTAHWHVIKTYGGSDLELRNVTVNATLGGGIEVAGGTVDIYDCTFTQEEYYNWNSVNVAVSNNGTANIHRGTFASENYGAYVFSSGGTINIEGGTFSAGKAVLKADNSTDDAQPSVINVTGGNFTGSFSVGDKATLAISDGYFTNNPAAYVAEGKAAVAETNVINGVTYYYTVENKAAVIDVETSVSAGEPSVNVSEESGITEETLKTALKSDDTADSMAYAAVNLSNDPAVVGTKQAAVEALGKDGITVGESETVTVVVEPYLKVDVTKYDTATKNLTLNIQAYYNVKATTDPSNMTIYNTAVLKTEQPMTVTTPVSITVPLPTGFTTGETLWVKHTKDNGKVYYYQGTVADDKVTFVNPKGFSAFDISESATPVASIDSVFYGTLQEAVNDVANGQTIVLNKSGESATVSRNISFSVDKNSYTCTLAPGYGYSMSQSGNTYTFTYVGVPDTGTSTPSGDYLITVDRTTGGKVTVNPGRADKGATVTITVKPDSGYMLDELTVIAKDGGSVKLTWKGDNKYTFTMPGSQVSVEATFVKKGGEQPAVTLPFTDVAESDWYYDAVQYVYENDLMNGTSATAFSPFVTTSRAMILTILARCDGVDTSTGSTWYGAGAAWAIAEGVSDGTNLEANLTREQLVTMLWRYAGSPVVESDLSGYPDSASVSDWAVNAMIWAVDNGVITGNGAGALNPQGTATRAEVATILMRVIEN